MEAVDYSAAGSFESQADGPTTQSSRGRGHRNRQNRSAANLAKDSNSSKRQNHSSEGSRRQKKLRHEKEMASIAANSQQAAMPPSQNGVTSIIIGPKFANLDMRTLKEYQKAFDLDVPQNISKTDLVDAINRHFAKSPKLREIEVVATFLQRLKQDKELESSDVQ